MLSPFRLPPSDMRRPRLRGHPLRTTKERLATTTTSIRPRCAILQDHAHPSGCNPRQEAWQWQRENFHLIPGFSVEKRATQSNPKSVPEFGNHQPTSTKKNFLTRVLFYCRQAPQERSKRDKGIDDRRQVKALPGRLWAVLPPLLARRRLCVSLVPAVLSDCSPRRGCLCS